MQTPHPPLDSTQKNKLRLLNVGFIKMKSTRQNGGEIFLIALAAIALGVFNLVIKRFIDGTLYIIGGICILLIWKKKHKK